MEHALDQAMDQITEHIYLLASTSHLPAHHTLLRLFERLSISLYNLDDVYKHGHYCTFGLSLNSWATDKTVEYVVMMVREIIDSGWQIEDLATLVYFHPVIFYEVLLTC